MKILHTSDWHLGRKLYGRSRYNEFSSFLEWLLEKIRIESVDLLIVAGDIFDTGTPGPRFQELYYDFLYRASKLELLQIVIVGGNHDSPTLLNAPKSLLKSLKISVIGSKAQVLEDDIVQVYNRDKELAGIVCGVPFLRDRDLRKIESGESMEDKESKFFHGITSYYRDIIRAGEKLRGSKPVPLILTGHLFMRGGKVSKDDGVRDLYVGTLGQIPSSIIPDSVDYMALGHLHQCQIVDNREAIRYSGTPIPMGFNEATSLKRVIIADVGRESLSVDEISVPSFRTLISVEGDLNSIKRELGELVNRNSEVWVEVDYTSNEPVSGLRDSVEDIVKDSPVNILAIKDRSVVKRILSQSGGRELEDLTPQDVFEKCLDVYQVENRDELISLFNETVDSLNLEV